MGYDQKHGGGYTDNVWVLDGIELTNAETTDEVHSKRVHGKEIAISSSQLSQKNGSSHMTAER